jgi:DNA-binding NarL/FixJ family response regulator
MDADSPTAARLTDTQRAILPALCRPIAAGNHFATPATNQEIAEAVFLSVDAVKGHLRTLYRKFGIEDLPHNQRPSGSPARSRRSRRQTASCGRSSPRSS